MPIDWATLSRLVPEVALVLIFMWYTRERDRANSDERQKRDATVGATQQHQHDEWRAFLAEERQVRQEMLREERQARAESTARLADEVKSIAVLTAATHATVTQHDQWARMEASRAAREQKP